MINRKPAHFIVALGYVSLMCLVLWVNDVGAQEKDAGVAAVRKGVAPKVRGASESDIMEPLGPTKGTPPELRGVPPEPDLTLDPCEVLCDRGAGYSREVCEQYGYSNQFVYEVRARIRNIGDKPANFESGWRVWQAVGLRGLEAALPVGTSVSQKAPVGGISLAFGAEMPESMSPLLDNLILSPGDQVVRFTVDPDNHIKENFENNNTIECSWKVVATAPASPYDLGITGLAVFPSQGSPWDDFTLVITVENLGDAIFDVIETTCIPGGRFYDASIDAGEEITTTSVIPGILSPGVHKVICTVRAPGYTEDDTSNNTMTTTFTVAPI